jgi:hypothetical protein
MLSRPLQGLVLLSRDPGGGLSVLSDCAVCALGAGTLSFELEYFCLDETGVKSETELSRDSPLVPEEALSLSKSSRTMESRRSDDVKDVPEPKLIKPFLDNG